MTGLRVLSGCVAWAVLSLVGGVCWAADDSAAARAVDVAFTSGLDGSEQRYLVVMPEGDDGAPDTALFYLHGHGSDRWQLVKQDRNECRAVLDVGRERNAICVAPDYRAKTSWMGPAAEADVAQIIGEVKARYGVTRIVLSGASMGGSSVLTFAALHPELVDGVVSMNGTANHLEYGKFQEAIAESFGGTKVQIPEEYKKRSAEYWPERFTMAVGITASGKDETVPPGSVVRLAGVLEAIGRPVLLVYREDGGHSTGYDDARAVLEFVFDRVGE